MHVFILLFKSILAYSKRYIRDALNDFQRNYKFELQLMHQLNFFQPQSLAHRRHTFIKEIRNNQRDQFKKRARRQVIMQTKSEQLDSLIDITKHHITHQELCELVEYANKHHHKAVAHLGNLILEGVVKVSQLEEFKLEPDYHPYWLWLVQVLVQNSYCTVELIQHCIKCIAPNKLEQTVKNALTVLYKIASSHIPSFSLREENVILSIINSTFQQESVSKVAYLLISQLINKEENLVQIFKEGLLREKLISSIKYGLASQISIIKRDSFKILIGLAINRVFFYQITLKLVTFIKSEAFQEYSEICLEYLLQVALEDERQTIVQLIQRGLLVGLSKWKRFYEEEDDSLAGKIIQICGQIRERVNGMGLLTKGIHLQLDKLNLLSFDVEIQI